MKTLLDVYGFFGTICGYWGGTPGNTPPWSEIPGLNDVSYDKIDKLLFTNYGDRPISRYLAEYVKMGGGELKPEAETIISAYVLDMCRLSWARLAADFGAVYNPIENYAMTENEGVTDAESGSDDTTRSYTDYKETVKLGHTVETTNADNTYGFDTAAADGVKADKAVNTEVFGKPADSGDTREYEGTYMDKTKYGHKNTRTRNFSRRGNIGTLTNTDMITSDAAFWSAENFFEHIAADIAAILTLPIYE